MTLHHQHTARTAASAVLAAIGLALSGCGSGQSEAEVDAVAEADGVTEGDILESPPPAAEPAEDGASNPDVGPYDREFYDELAASAGQEVTLTADVHHIISPRALTVGDPDDQTLDPLLVVHDLEPGTLEAGLLVEVTGTIGESFAVSAAEEQLGVDLADPYFDDHEGEPWVRATEITVPGRS